MKANILKKICSCMLILFIVFTIKSYAAKGSFSATVAGSQLQEGKTTTLTISVSNCEGKFTIASSDASVATVSSGSEWIDGSKTITITAKKAGNATITVTATDVADSDEKDVVGSKSFKIAVTAPQTENPPPTTPTQPTQNTTPTQPAQNTTPTQPAQNTTPTQPVQNTTPTQPVQNTTPTQPVQNTTPTQPAQNTTPAQPVQNATPAQQPTQNNQQNPAPTFTAVNDTVYAKSTVNVRSTWSTSGDILGQLGTGTKVTRTGIGSNGWDRIIYNGTIAYINKDYIDTKEPEKEKSSNKSLKELQVENYELSPAFDPQTTKYSLTLNNTDTKLDITAIADDEEKAKVNIEGNTDFKVGNNIVKITVTAEDGTTRMYTITVSKANESGEIETLRLSSLKIGNASLEPEFNKDTTNYIIYVENPSTIKAADVVAVAEDTNVNITTAENDGSTSDEKLIMIILESKDGNKNGVYQVSVKKKVAPIEQQLGNSSNDNSIYYILGGIIGVLLFLIIVVIIAIRKTSEEDDDEYEDEEDYDEEDIEEYKDSKRNVKYNENLKSTIDQINNTDDEEDRLPKSQILSKKIKLDTDKYEETADNKKSTVRLNLNNVSVDNDDENISNSSNKKGKHF